MSLHGRNYRGASDSAAQSQQARRKFVGHLGVFPYIVKKINISILFQHIFKLSTRKVKEPK